MNRILPYLLAVLIPISVVTIAAEKGRADADTPAAHDRRAVETSTEVHILLAQAGSGTVVVGGDGSAAPATKPSDTLHDPLVAPSATFDDLKAAKKLGWGVLFLAGLVIGLRLLGKAGGIFKPLASNKVVLFTGAGLAFAASAYDALLGGGSWMSSLAIAIAAGFAWWDVHKKPEPAKVVS